jgi:hypothetical protein
MPTRTSAGVHTASYTVGTGSFPGVKQLGHHANSPPPSSVKVKERIQLQLHNPSGPS